MVTYILFAMAASFIIPMLYLWIFDMTKQSKAAEFNLETPPLALIYDEDLSKISYHFSPFKILFCYFFFFWDCLYFKKTTTVFVGSIREISGGKGIIYEPFDKPVVGIYKQMVNMNYVCGIVEIIFRPKSEPASSVYCVRDDPYITLLSDKMPRLEAISHVENHIAAIKRYTGNK